MKDKKSDKARKADRETAIKSELLNFRMPADRIRLIYEIAESNKVNVSTLLRDWINEKIDEASGSDSKPPTDEQIQFLSEALDALSKRLRVLEGQAKSSTKKPAAEAKVKTKGAAEEGEIGLGNIIFPRASFGFCVPKPSVHANLILGPNNNALAAARTNAGRRFPLELFKRLLFRQYTATICCGFSSERLSCPHRQRAQPNKIPAL